MGVYFARQPVFDSENNVLAYELPYKLNGEVPPAHDLKDIVGGVKAFVRLPENAGKISAPSEVLSVETSSAEELSSLKENGYTVIFDGDDPAAFKSADIVRIDFRKSPIIIEETAAACREYEKPILAANLETREESEYAKRLGAAYFHGFFYAKPREDELHPLPANIMNAMTLMSQPEPEIGDVVETLSQDAEICRKILRLINSVYFGVTNKVSSISQAILILGLDYLREWIYLMGVQKITHNENFETIRLSLLNAKLCRKISEAIPGAETDSFYLMGLLSTGVFGGKKQFAKALAEFPLSDEIKQGLLRKGGLYSDVLEMVLSYGRADWARFEQTAQNYDTDGIADLYADCAREVEQRLGV